jgi:hypothetical protein
MSRIPKNLDDLIEKEKRSLAGEYFEEAWMEMREDGLSARLIAEVYIDLALKKLVVENGDAEASKLLAHFRKLDEMGFIPASHTLQ